LKSFDRFIGIDWSGAAGEYQSGIQVAEIDIDAKHLRLIPPPRNSHWSRERVLDFVTKATDRRTLVGFDFAFSLPWNRDLQSLPVCFGGLAEARALWTFIDEFCNGSTFLHASPIWQSPESPFRPFIKFWSRASQYQGDLFNGGQLRRTEIAAQASGLRPKSVYRLAGSQIVEPGRSCAKQRHRDLAVRQGRNCKSRTRGDLPHRLLSTGRSHATITKAGQIGRSRGNRCRYAQILRCAI